MIIFIKQLIFEKLDTLFTRHPPENCFWCQMKGMAKIRLLLWCYGIDFAPIRRYSPFCFLWLNIRRLRFSLCDLSVYMSVLLSVGPLSVCTYVLLTVLHSFFLSVCLSVGMSVLRTFRLSFCLSFHLTFWLLGCPSVFCSFYLSVVLLLRQTLKENVFLSKIIEAKLSKT